MRSPERVAMRTFLPSTILNDTREGLPVFGSWIATLQTAIGASDRSSPPCGLTCVGFLWRVPTFTPDTPTLPIAGSAFKTSPRRTFSLPLRTQTLSPFLIFPAHLTKNLRSSEERSVGRKWIKYVDYSCGGEH